MLRESTDTHSQSPQCREAAVESACHVLLRRYGVVFRDLMERETAMPKWRELVGMFRRLEARGVVRGGRFVSGFGGEQFALTEAVDSLRAMRGRGGQTDAVAFSAADPMNLVGVVIPGEREASVPGRTVTYPALTAAPAAALIQAPTTALPPALIGGGFIA